MFWVIQEIQRLGTFTTHSCCLKLLRSWRCGPERLERVGPCWLDCWNWGEWGTQRVQMKGVLPWLFRWACAAGTRDFCPALAALIGPVQNIFSSPYTISMPLSLSPSKLGRQLCWVACLLVSVSGADRAKYFRVYYFFLVRMKNIFS